MEVLCKIGFGAVWIRCIWGNLSMASTQILVNGMSRGSPILDDILAGYWDFASSFQEGSAEGLYSSIVYISLFADDVTIFTKSLATTLEIYSTMLEDFGTMLSFWINLNKNVSLPIHSYAEQSYVPS